MKFSLFTPPLLLLFFLFGCKEETNLKDYYFQMDEFTETQVYKFEYPEFGLIEYWEMTYFPKDSTFFTKSYNEELEETYFMKEKISENGASVIGYGRNIHSPIGKITLTKDKILKKDVYIWEEQGPFSYKVEFNSENEDHQTFERNRSFMDFVTVKVNNKDYKAAKFKDEFTLENLTTGTIDTYTNYSYYGLGMGCIKIEMEGQNKSSYHNYELVQVISGSEWAKLLSSK